MGSNSNKKGGKKEGGLSHDEIWDDSVLIDSWNEALAEYKKYHSIHLKGGDVEDLLSEDAQADTTPRSDAAPGEHANTSEPSPTQQDGNTGVVPDEAEGCGHGGPALIEPPMPPPQVILGSVRDEGLKKLLMSWYYAGYYTGLYEGQQQAQQAQQKPQA